ncbi:MAG: hypothetical protein AB1Z19_08995, partial [Eubacteriales bacterium]
MCGIIGLYQKTLSAENAALIKKSITYLMKETEIRGNDTSGLQVKNGASLDKYLFKRNFKASRLVREKAYKTMLNNALSTKDAFVSAIGHCRMQTNGDCMIEHNNQPTIKEETVCVHNGIITNIDALYEKHTEFDRAYDIDTELICDFFNAADATTGYNDILAALYDDVYGETTFGLMPEGYDDLIFSTNSGSSYYILDEKTGFFVFASEYYIMKKYCRTFSREVGHLSIQHLKPGQAIVIDEKTGATQIKPIGELTDGRNVAKASYTRHTDSILVDKKRSNTESEYTKDEASLLEYNEEALKNLKRCTKCLLPESFPFIEFDEDGVCNYCHNHTSPTVDPQATLDAIIEESKTGDDKKFLLTFSGGRDSSYGMHMLHEMDANFFSYTYDWGMVTELARRNQSRMCGKLGVEHIIVSADIDKNRLNIQRNVRAWLKRPSLGLVPLFMAGDKLYFYYANKVAKDNDIDNLVVLCDNPSEVTYFKSGFSGAKPKFQGKAQIFSISFWDNMRMVGYYLKEFLLNPRLLNRSMLETMKAYLSYYLIPHHYINLFKYLEWDEDTIEKLLKEEYAWELSPDTDSTWRIGDATAPFYNYIYTTVAGFSENDTFRSNQIRDGVLTRKEGMKLILRDNRPRYESIKWYLDTIGIDFEYA